MMKFSFAFVALLVAGAVAVPLANRVRPDFRAAVLDNEQWLDAPNNQILLRWSVLPGTGDIEMEVQANCTGWIGLAWSVGTLFVNATGDIILVGYDDANDSSYVEDRVIDLGVPVPSNGGELDASPDVIVKGGSYQEPWTIVRFLRSLNTGDPEDLPIVPGPMSIAWTFAASDDTEVPHDIKDTGFATVTFYN